jgi:TRAP-type C4-dicarboxylate transport system permease small subunit
MKALDRFVRALARLGIALAAIALLASMFLIGYSVVMRYFLNQPAAWVDELAGYLLVAAVMVALSALLLALEGVDMVGFSRMVGLMSNGYLAVPMWIPQLLVPIGAALMLAAAVIAFAAAWRNGEVAPAVTELHRTTGIE